MTKAEHKGDSWTAVHAPRNVGAVKDAPPATSWWAEVKPEEFRDRAREEFQARMRRSERNVGQRGIDG